MAVHSSQVVAAMSITSSSVLMGVLRCVMAGNSVPQAWVTLAARVYLGRYEDTSLQCSIGKGVQEPSYVASAILQQRGGRAVSRRAASVLYDKEPEGKLNYLISGQTRVAMIEQPKPNGVLT